MISVVVPLYFNRIELYPIIVRFLTSCIYQDGKMLYRDGIELIVVDDCSPLDTSDWPISIRNEANFGYTKTVNEGIKKALGDIIVVANDDLVLTDALFDRIASVQDDQLGIFSPKTTDEGTGDRFGSIWLLTRVTLEKMGYLDENLKHYFSDTEFYDRAKKLDIPITKWDDIVIKHVGGATYKFNHELYEADHAHYRNMV